MRVHLAVQVVSKSVAQLIDRYAAVNDLGPKYAPLRDIVLACDRLVDICNANYAKGCECINSPDHNHVKELQLILLLFAEWKSKCKMKEEFITNESYEDLCWLVYGSKGIDQEYLLNNKSRQMMQRRHGSDCRELEFAAFRQANSNGFEYDIRGIEARRSACR